ncbi:MAG: DUF58 domain-containing protein [Maioricimonas sp. JB049]
MTASSSPITSEMLARLSGLELRARVLVEGYLAGLHRSPHEGFSVEFAEHREYVPGDDLRYLDWKVFGKRDRYYLKQFEAETTFTCHLLVDLSESMVFRSSDAALSKADYAKCLAAAIASIVLRQQDAVGLTIFDSQVRSELPVSGKRSQLQEIIRRLETSEPAGESAIGDVLHDIARRLGRRSVVIVISDLFDEPDQIAAGLQHLRFQRHDLSVLQVIDPAEADFPFDEPARFLGLEDQQEQFVEPRLIRQAYLEEFTAARRTIEAACHAIQGDYLLAATDDPADRVLSRFISHRDGGTRR